MIGTLRNCLHTHRIFMALWLLLTVLAATTLSAMPQMADAHSSVLLSPAMTHQPSYHRDHQHSDSVVTHAGRVHCNHDGKDCCSRCKMVCRCAEACSGGGALSSIFWLITDAPSARIEYPAVLPPNIPRHANGPPLRPPTA